MAPTKKARAASPSPGLRLGTSGWEYDSWRGLFYPLGVPRRRWLELYAASFCCVEVNNTFYRLPPADTFADWYRRTPPSFVFVTKMSRYLTHVKRLRDPAEPAARFLERSAPLREKRGPVLVQLPPTLRRDVGLLRAALEALTPMVRVAVEFRDESWFTEPVAAVLRARDVALCVADRRSALEGPLWATATWGYIRFHEGRARPVPHYGRHALDSWVDRVSETWPGGEVFAFFNNDAGGAAVRDALAFGRLAARRGLQVDLPR